jgi:hypothetical protein
VPGIVTIINDSEDVHFIIEKNGSTANKVIILTNEGWYSINDKKARFMKLLR